MAAHVQLLLQIGGEVSATTMENDRAREIAIAAGLTKLDDKHMVQLANSVASLCCLRTRYLESLGGLRPLVGIHQTHDRQSAGLPAVLL